MSAKRNMKAAGMCTDTWETLASNRKDWKTETQRALQRGEALITTAAEDKRARRKAREAEIPSTSNYICQMCMRICKSRIGLVSHSNHCKPDESPQR